MSVKLLTEYHLEVLSLKGSCTGSSESTLVKMPHCLKSHVTTQMSSIILTHKSLMKSNFVICCSCVWPLLNLDTTVLPAKSDSDIIFCLQSYQGERSGSVVECLTRDRRTAGLSLTGITALCP